MTNRSSSAARKRRQQQQQRTTSQTVPNPNPPGPISNLGDDLLLEILIRLPSPSSAARCTPVCQRWRSLVSTPLFIHRFVSIRTTATASTSAGEPISLITSSDSPPKPIQSFLPHLPPNVRRRFKVVDSFKDLVLCGYSDRIEDGYGCTAYLICNPFSKQWVALPLAPRKPLNLRVVARLVCRTRNAKRFELDDGETFNHYDYKFRVVLMYRWQQHWQDSTVVDVFSSESWGWTEAVRFLDHPEVGPPGGAIRNVVSCNGELFWSGIAKDEDVERDRAYYRKHLFVFDPFHIDKPATSIMDHCVHAQREARFWDISISRGAVHLVRLEVELDALGGGGGGLRNVLTVWRLGGKGIGRTWWRRYSTFLETSKCENFDDLECCMLVLHPEKPEIVFLEVRDSRQGGNNKETTTTVFTCDMRKGNLEYFARVKRGASRWPVFHPRANKCFPTPIPRHLKGASTV